VQSAAHEKGDHESSMRVEEELIVPLADGLQRQDYHEADGDVCDDTRLESPIAERGIEDGAAERIFVDKQLLCP
jgi:hypothetical protein